MHYGIRDSYPGRQSFVIPAHGETVGIPILSDEFDKPCPPELLKDDERFFTEGEPFSDVNLYRATVLDSEFTKTIEVFDEFYTSIYGPLGFLNDLFIQMNKAKTKYRDYKPEVEKAQVVNAGKTAVTQLNLRFAEELNKIGRRERDVAAMRKAFILPPKPEGQTETLAFQMEIFDARHQLEGMTQDERTALVLENPTSLILAALDTAIRPLVAPGVIPQAEAKLIDRDHSWLDDYARLIENMRRILQVRRGEVGGKLGLVLKYFHVTPEELDWNVDMKTQYFTDQSGTTTVV